MNSTFQNLLLKTKTSTSKAIGLAALMCAGLLSLPSQAGVVVAPGTPYLTHLFSANCIDCAVNAEQTSYAVSGTFTIWDIGGNFQSTFRSFTYEGSNLMDAFYVGEGSDGRDDTTDYNFYDLAENQDGTAISILFSDTGDGYQGFFFYVNLASGMWSACGPGPGDWNCSPDTDYGNQAKITRQSNEDPKQVPEPGSLALVTLALAGLTTLRRKA